MRLDELVRHREGWGNLVGILHGIWRSLEQAVIGIADLPEAIATLAEALPDLMLYAATHPWEVPPLQVELMVVGPLRDIRDDLAASVEAAENDDQIESSSRAIQGTVKVLGLISGIEGALTATNRAPATIERLRRTAQRLRTSLAEVSSGSMAQGVGVGGLRFATRALRFTGQEVASAWRAARIKALRRRIPRYSKPDMAEMYVESLLEQGAIPNARNVASVVPGHIGAPPRRGTGRPGVDLYAFRWAPRGRRTPTAVEVKHRAHHLDGRPPDDVRLTELERSRPFGHQSEPNVVADDWRRWAEENYLHARRLVHDGLLDPEWVPDPDTWGSRGDIEAWRRWVETEGSRRLGAEGGRLFVVVSREGSAGLAEDARRALQLRRNAVLQVPEPDGF